MDEKINFIAKIIVISAVILSLGYISIQVFNIFNTEGYFTLIFALSLVIVTLLYWDTSKRNMWHQALINVQKDYQSAEMGYAVQTLWDFFRDKCQENEDELKKEYEKIFNKEIKELEDNNSGDKIQYKKETFDYQRRLVTIYYQHINDLYKNRILPRKIVHSFWSWEDLKIIEYILIPLNEKLEEIVKAKEKRDYKPHKTKNDVFAKLYNDSIDHYNKTKDC